MGGCYEDFLRTKDNSAAPAGFAPAGEINPRRVGFQRDVVRWGLGRGRAAAFLDCGLGKSAIELEWGRQVAEHVGKPVLMLTPLAVAKQMGREAEKFGVPIKVCRTAADVTGDAINVLNYERMAGLDPSDFGGIVLDESSILKSYEGSTRKLITDFARTIPYRLAATATPAPNDMEELGTHAEFTDAMTRKEMLAQFFTQDGNIASKFRLKGHAVRPFWRWMASWAVAMRRPSDLGHDDAGFILPELRIHDVQVSSPLAAGTLFAVDSLSLQERRDARRNSLDARADATAGLVEAAPGVPWLLWCDLNAEAEALTDRIADAVEVRGSEPAEAKEEKLEAFSAGEIRVLVTKPTIAGFGLNWQHCSNMAFCGLSDSYEQQYQAIRRCWRFGQRRPVDVYFVSSEAEGAVVDNVRRKERQAAEMFNQIVAHMGEFSIGRQRRDHADYAPSMPMILPSWLEPVA